MKSIKCDYYISGNPLIKCGKLSHPECGICLIKLRDMPQFLEKYVPIPVSPWQVIPLNRSLMGGVQIRNQSRCREDAGWALAAKDRDNRTLVSDPEHPHCIFGPAAHSPGKGTAEMGLPSRRYHSAWPLVCEITGAR